MDFTECLHRYIHLVTACGIVRLRHFQYPPCSSFGKCCRPCHLAKTSLIRTPEYEKYGIIPTRHHNMLTFRPVSPVFFRTFAAQNVYIWNNRLSHRIIHNMQRQ